MKNLELPLLIDPPTLTLGLPYVVDRSVAESIELIARKYFVLHFGSSASLEEDLEASGTLFDPVAQGQRLRKMLARLTPLSANADSLPTSWLLRVSEELSVITPEGIAGWHAIRAGLDDVRTQADVLLAEHTQHASAYLLAQYKQWSRHRLDSVVALLNGNDKPLQVQAAGVLLAMLVNDNTSPERALYRFGAEGGKRRDEIDRAFWAPVFAFSSMIAPDSKPKSGGARLISGWPMGEVARRLGSNFVLTNGSVEDPGMAYVEPGGVAAAVKLVSRDLARGHRRRSSVDELAAAFDSLVDAFRDEREALAGFGLLHENPRKTRQLRGLVLDEYSDSLASAVRQDAS